VALTCGFCGTASAPPPRVVVHEVERVVERLVVRDAGAGAAKMACLRCGEGMHEIDIDRMTVTQCPRCGGAWVTTDVATAMRRTSNDDLRKAVSRGEIFSRAKPERKPLACPVCARPMECVGMSWTVHDVDVCKEHGTWFDRTELGAFMDREKSRRERGE
jgi:Zn-finger nucleic acid-binding protein